MDNLELFRLYQEGHTLQQIGDMVNLSKQAISLRLRQVEGYDPEQDRQKRDKEIIRLYEESNLKAREIAEKFEISMSMLFRILGGAKRRRRRVK